MQRVALHHLVGQHGDLVARHVDRGQALAPQPVNRAARQHGQAWCCNVNAHRDHPTAQALHRQGIINLGGGGVVNRESLNRGQWQLVADGRCGQRRKAGAAREVLQQKAPPVELVGRINGAGSLQQLQHPELRGPRGFHHRFVLGRILVGLEQNFVQLLAHRRRALALAQLLHPLFNL